MNFRKINKEEFENLKRLFPDNDKMWNLYKEKRIKQLDERENDIFIIEEKNIKYR